VRQKTGKNFIEYFITIWVVITLNFILPRLMPGDPFLILTSQSAEDEEIVLSEEQREFLFEYYGLDQPIYKQYLNYLGELVQGNMGFSVYYKQPVSQIVLQRLPWSIFMVLLAVFFEHFYRNHPGLSVNDPVSSLHGTSFDQYYYSTGSVLLGFFCQDSPLTDFNVERENLY
jgi:ABC-type microcin C transport system permease subunit YejB